MQIFNFENMKNGWFVGNFTPTAFKTSAFEVCYKKHSKGEVWDTHYHKLATEINYLIKGKMVIQSTIIEAGSIFVLEPFEVADPVFLDDCELIIIKTPSDTNDKYPLK